MHHPIRLHYIGLTHWKRTHSKFLVPQNVHRFLCMQTELFSNFHKSLSSLRYNHLEADNREPSTAEAVKGSTSVYNTIQPTTHDEMIREYFDVSKTTAHKMVEKNDRIKKCNVHILARNMNTLQENDVDAIEVRNHMALLYRCPLTMEHNIAIMKEMRLRNLTAERVLQFHQFYKGSVAALKRWGILSEGFDPLEVLAPLGMPDEVLRNVKELHNINNFSLEQLHWKLSCAYLSWRLECSNEEISRIHRTYRLVKKSMMLQRKVLDQLIHEWNIYVPKIRQNGYLLKCSPVNIDLIDSKVKNIAGIDVREYASLTPRLLTIPYHHLLQVRHILSQLPISTAAVKTVPRICTLHPDTLNERIMHLQQGSDFSALQSHPRMLHLIFYHKKINSRLDLLQQLKKSNVLPSLNTVSGARKAFDKYMEVGDLRQNKKDIIMLLSQHLNVKPSAIRNCLHPHCWGSQTTLVNVKRNLLVLQETGFTADQILSGLDVVLYPPDLVQDQLNQLPQRPQIQPFSRFKSKINVLQHLLYFMEKNASLTSL